LSSRCALAFGRRRRPVDATEHAEPFVVLVGGGGALVQDRAAGAPAGGLGSVVGVVAGPQLVPAGFAAPGASAFGGEVDEGSGQLLGGSHALDLRSQSTHVDLP